MKSTTQDDFIIKVMKEKAEWMRKVRTIQKGMNAARETCSRHLDAAVRVQTEGGFISLGGCAGRDGSSLRSGSHRKILEILDLDDYMDCWVKAVREKFFLGKAPSRGRVVQSR